MTSSFFCSLIKNRNVLLLSFLNLSSNILFLLTNGNVTPHGTAQVPECVIEKVTGTYQGQTGNATFIVGPCGSARISSQNPLREPHRHHVSGGS